MEETAIQGFDYRLKSFGAHSVERLPELKHTTHSPAASTRETGTPWVTGELKYL